MSGSLKYPQVVADLLRARATFGIATSLAALNLKSIDSGYEVQSEFAASSGLTTVGWKIGATSAISQKALGLEEPASAYLFKQSTFVSPATIEIPNARCVLEAEVTVELARALPRRNAAYTIEEIAASIAAIYPSIEVCFARVDTAGPVSPPVAIADNFYHGALVLGPRRTDWQNLDLASLQVKLQLGDAPAKPGSGSNVLEHPFNAVRWLANDGSTRAELAAGDLIATGACVSTVVESGLIGKATFDDLGEVKFELVRKP